VRRTHHTADLKYDDHNIFDHLKILVAGEVEIFLSIYELSTELLYSCIVPIWMVIIVVKKILNNLVDSDVFLTC